MAQSYATEKLIKFSNKLLKQVYEMSVFDKIVNRDYEGEVKDQASTVKIGSNNSSSSSTLTGVYDFVHRDGTFRALNGTRVEVVGARDVLAGDATRMALAGLRPVLSACRSQPPCIA